MACKWESDIFSPVFNQLLSRAHLLISSFHLAHRLQTFLGYFAFHELITGGRLAGIVLILGGSTIYTFARDKEMRASEAAATTIPTTRQDATSEENLDAIVVEGKSVEQAVDEKNATPAEEE